MSSDIPRGVYTASGAVIDWQDFANNTLIIDPALIDDDNSSVAALANLSPIDYDATPAINAAGHHSAPMARGDSTLDDHHHRSLLSEREINHEYRISHGMQQDDFVGHAKIHDHETEYGSEEVPSSIGSPTTTYEGAAAHLNPTPYSWQVSNTDQGQLQLILTLDKALDSDTHKKLSINPEAPLEQFLPFFCDIVKKKAEDCHDPESHVKLKSHSASAYNVQTSKQRIPRPSLQITKNGQVIRDADGLLYDTNGTVICDKSNVALTLEQAVTKGRIVHPHCNVDGFQFDPEYTSPGSLLDNYTESDLPMECGAIIVEHDPKGKSSERVKKNSKGENLIGPQGRELKSYDGSPDQVSSAKKDTWKLAVLARTLKMPTQDIVDRMITPHSVSAITNRLSKWYQKNGGNFSMIATHRTAIREVPMTMLECMENLSNAQLNRNTCWELHPAGDRMRTSKTSPWIALPVSAPYSFLSQNTCLLGMLVKLREYQAEAFRKYNNRARWREVVPATVRESEEVKAEKAAKRALQESTADSARRKPRKSGP